MRKFKVVLKLTFETEDPEMIEEIGEIQQSLTEIGQEFTEELADDRLEDLKVKVTITEIV